MILAIPSGMLGYASQNCYALFRSLGKRGKGYKKGYQNGKLYYRGSLSSMQKQTACSYEAKLMDAHGTTK